MPCQDGGPSRPGGTTRRDGGGPRAGRRLEREGTHMPPTVGRSRRPSGSPCLPSVRESSEAWCVSGSARVLCAKQTSRGQPSAGLCSPPPRPLSGQGELTQACDRARGGCESSGSKRKHRRNRREVHRPLDQRHAPRASRESARGRLVEDLDLGGSSCPAKCVALNECQLRARLRLSCA